MIWIARSFGLADAALGIVLTTALASHVLDGNTNAWSLAAVFVGALPLVAFAATIWPHPGLVACQLITTAFLVALVLPLGLSVGGILLVLACLSFLAMLFTVGEVVKRERRGDEYWRQHAGHPGWTRYRR